LPLSPCPGLYSKRASLKFQAVKGIGFLVALRHDAPQVPVDHWSLIATSKILQRYAAAPQVRPLPLRFDSISARSFAGGVSFELPCPL
jgi:hypothetical protein